MIGLNSQLIVETTFIIKSFPDEIKKASSMIYDYLKAVGNDEAIRLYNLEPFDIRVQTLERTLIDKVFAICYYMIDDKSKKHSRHIYDIYQLIKIVKLNNELKILVNEVRNERKNGDKCYSAKDGENVSNLLKTMIDTKYYKIDYEKCTLKLLSHPISYEEAIKAIDAIIESGVFN